MKTEKIKLVGFNRKTLDFELIEVDLFDTHAFLDHCYRVCECRTVDTARVDTDLRVWVDDDGLYTKRDQLSLVAEYPQPLAGGIVFSHNETDDEGNTLGVPERWLENDMALLRAAIMPVEVR